MIRKFVLGLGVLLLLLGSVGCKADSTGGHPHQNNGEPASPPSSQENHETVTLTIAGDKKTGTIMATTKVPIKENESLLDATVAVLKNRKIQYSVRGSGATAYVEGIDNLYEFDEGPMSGWEAKKNGKTISQSAGITPVHNGDVIQWVYTTNYKKN